MLASLKNSPAAARAFPFLAYVLLTACQGKVGAASLYWVYALKTLVALLLVLWIRPALRECRWSVNLVSVSAGAAVFAVWVGLDGLHPTLNQIAPKLLGARDPSWKPFEFFAAQPGWAWMFIVVRILGTTYVVPPIEEAFYRSLMYRSVARADFESFPLSQFSLMSFVVTSVVFGLMHPNQWIAGIFCGCVYQALVLRCGHLGEAMAAHGVTNFLLGTWVVYKGAWQFW
ncbi:MAG: CAAX prenyl protease-related protein [Verrucomicrobia bacterium]|nr:CAAX prenyl protease-related protein [Verrucomicrobiota bacterium]MBI3869615.1 CAAX prenyl protease-related protein [Verrucomicrobiota bacterium]